jgi:phosphatidylglycerophosphate synthase
MPEHTTTAPLRGLPELRRSARLGLAAFAVGAPAAVALTHQALSLPLACLGIAGLAVLLVATLAWAGLPAHLPHRRFGPANQVTLLRAGLTVWLLALACAPGALARAGWLPFVAATTLLALDGVDGWLARRTGLASAFGARFDMEVDAVLILVLATLVYLDHRAGPWVLAAGLLRYGFVGAGKLWPWMARSLPPRRWRQTACVVQTAALLACLIPGAASPWTSAVAGIGLAGLVLSFAADTRWLVQRRNLQEA